MFTVLHGYPVTAVNHSCATCNKSGMPNEIVVDIDFAVYDDTPNGDLYFCIDCAGELASTLGWLSPTLADELRLSVVEAHEGANAATEIAAKMTEAYNALIDALVSNPDLANEIALSMRGKEKRAPIPHVDPDANYVEPLPVQAGVVVPKSR
jgi:hypothetical protein